MAAAGDVKFDLSANATLATQCYEILEYRTSQPPC
jgi:hypothetical protein